MANILHIVNGDITADILEKTILSGDIIVWREMLCEGPVCENFGSDDFWKIRYDYFEKEIGVSKQEYFDKTIKEIVQLKDISDYSEVVLWFEFDLFCQVNLMALCSYLLSDFRKKITYKLICTGWVKGKDSLQSLSGFNLNEFVDLYESSVIITEDNLEYAAICWKVFAENNKNKLQEFNFNKQQSKFNYFQKAIDQHLLRFPDKNGFNQIENKILEIIDSKPLNSTQIIQKMLIWQTKETVYGFGDLQYFLALKKMKKHYTIIESQYFVTSEVKKLLTV